MLILQAFQEVSRGYEERSHNGIIDVSSDEFMNNHLKKCNDLPSIKQVIKKLKDSKLDFLMKCQRSLLGLLFKLTE